MEIFCIIWAIFAVVVVLGGSIAMAIYNGYRHAKNMSGLSSEDEDTIFFGMFAVAALPATLFLGAIALIIHIPYLFGKLIGKHF